MGPDADRSVGPTAKGVRDTGWRHLERGFSAALSDRPLSALVESVPVREVHPYCDPSRLPELCSTILGDLEALSIAPSRKLSKAETHVSSE